MLVCIVWYVMDLLDEILLVVLTLLKLVHDKSDFSTCIGT